MTALIVVALCLTVIVLASFVFVSRISSVMLHDLPQATLLRRKQSLIALRDEHLSATLAAKTEAGDRHWRECLEQDERELSFVEQELERRSKTEQK